MTTIDIIWNTHEKLEISNPQTAEMLEQILTEYYTLQDLVREASGEEQSLDIANSETAETIEKMVIKYYTMQEMGRGIDKAQQSLLAHA